MKKLIIATMLFMVSITTYSVNVAAASNLKFVLEELKTAFIKKNPNTKVQLTFGSSGMLAQQIINGANFDLFMSADNDYPVKIIEHHLHSGKMETYAFGKLVIYSTTIDVKRLGIKSLRDKSVKKIAIANPATATYGNRAVEVLQHENIYELLKPKLVIGENISQCSQFIFSGNVELGFTALSLALSEDMKQKGNYYIVPNRYYKPIEQACVLIKAPTPDPAAVLFQKYILSAAAKVIWKKHGYGVP
jgi:molybdate transport system substrate-binding protein